MKKLLLVFILSTFLTPCSMAESSPKFSLGIFHNDTRAIKSVLNSQVRYANRTNFNKFIATYDTNYKNSDGFDLETYSKLVKEIWESYDKIKYGIKIKDVTVDDDTATVSVIETSFANMPASAHMDGVLNSESDSIYNLKKIDGKWKVVSDSVVSEKTSMLYGEARNLDIKLTAPEEIQPNKEYTATLEFEPPKDTIAIASIANDKVEYPQKPTKEVFRKLPEDNILERLFVSNSDNVNEYIVASIGLTKADVSDLSIKLSLTGFGYQITRVNVVPPKTNEEKNDESK